MVNGKSNMRGRDRRRGERPRRMGAAILSGWAAIALAVSAAADPSFELGVTAEEFRIGDRAEFYIKTNDPEFDPLRIESVEFTGESDAWHVAEPWQPTRGREKKSEGWLWRATAQVFDLGEFSSPGVRVRYRGDDGKYTAIELGGVAVRTESVLTPEESENPQLRGLKPPTEIPRNWTGMILVALLLLTFGLAAFFLIRRWLRRRQEAMPPAPPEPELPPGIWAMREIDRRSRLPASIHGPVKELATLASEVVRMYFGRRYGFPAMEMTTYECLITLSSRRVAIETHNLIRKFLDECDLMKFSKYEIAGPRWKSLWDDARAIVHVTTPEEEFAPAPPERSEKERAGAAAP